ncbi:MAG TPA: DUF502 domain-containing protein [Polyangia bacterium]|nr:DUF502 domain-containing protein [Polyangia bacterium]
MLRTLGRLIKNELVTGMVLLAPVAGTAYLVYSIVRGIDGLFPDALRPRVLGVPLPGLGVASVLVLALLVGLVAHNFLGQRLVGLFDKMFSRVPLFGGTYGLIKQVFESVFSQGAESFNRAVLIEYPRAGIYAIAFVTAEHSGAVLSPDGKELVSVFVPTTPNPTSGFFLLVEKSLMRELDMPVQAAFKLVVTMGIAKEPEILTTTAKLSRKTLTNTN